MLGTLFRGPDHRLSPGLRSSIGIAFVAGCVYLFAVPIAVKAERTIRPDATRALRNTYYYLVLEENFPKEKNTALLTRSGKVLAKVNSEFKAAIEIEGSGKLTNGKIVNHDGWGAKGSSDIRFAFTVHPYGRGVGNCPIIPFYSVAVDPKVIPLGSELYIEETEGMKLPDGSTHSGIWRAVDVGPAIKGDRIDLFVGTDHEGTALEAAGIEHLQPLTVKVVSAPSTTCMEESPR